MRDNIVRAKIKQWRPRGMTLLTCLTDLEMLRSSAQTLGRALHA